MKNIIVSGLLLIIASAANAQRYQGVGGDSASFNSDIQISEREEARLENTYRVSLHLDQTRQKGVIKAKRGSESFFRILSEDVLRREIEIRKPSPNERIFVPTLYFAEPYYISNHGKKPTRIPFGSLFFDGNGSLYGRKLPQLQIRGNELDLQTLKVDLEESFSSPISDYYYVTVVEGRADSILDSLNRERAPALVVKTLDGGVHIFHLLRDTVYDSFYTGVIEDTVAIR